MNTSLTSFLDSTANQDEIYSDFLDTPPPEESPLITLAEGEIDPRLQLFSHSSRTTLHKCPRKYQLYRLNSKDTEIEDTSTSVTFAYGSAVGVGIQSCLEGKSEKDILLDTFLEWDTDLLAANRRQKKSIWEAIFAVQRFIYLKKEQSYLGDYELVYHAGKPAIELSFQIILPNGFKYRGFLDGVLQHKISGEILVLELKTTAGTPQAATYKNSGQAIGYSVILDQMFPDLSSYEVLYLVYATRSRDFTELYFTKTLLQRALWLQDLLIDCEHIQLYESYQNYPIHGESCYDFFRECEYMGLCTLSTERLVKPLRQSHLDYIAKQDGSYDFNVDFHDLINRQLEKGE